MPYQLSETDKAQLQILRTQIFLQYREEDALVIEKIIDRSLLNGRIEKDDVYELIKLLPKIISSPNEEAQVDIEEQSTDWNEYIDERRARFRRTEEKLHQILSDWVFMQSAVYRRKMEPTERVVGKVKSINNGHGMIK